MRRVVCLLCVGFFVALALQGMKNVRNDGATVDSYYSSTPTTLPLDKNFVVPKLEGRKMRPKKFDTFRDIKRRVPNGSDPIHNRRAGKSGQPPGRQ